MCVLKWQTSTCLLQYSQVRKLLRTTLEEKPNWSLAQTARNWIDSNDVDWGRSKFRCEFTLHALRSLLASHQASSSQGLAHGSGVYWVHYQTSVSRREGPRERSKFWCEPTLWSLLASHQTISSRGLAWDLGCPSQSVWSLLPDLCVQRRRSKGEVQVLVWRSFLT